MTAEGGGPSGQTMLTMWRNPDNGVYAFVKRGSGERKCSLSTDTTHSEGSQ